MKLWTEIFDTKLKCIHQQTSRSATNLVLELSKKFTASAKLLCPSIDAPLKSLKDGIDHLRPVMEQSYNKTWEKKLSGTREWSHRQVQPQIYKFMIPIYERAGRERGKPPQFYPSSLIR
jgi:hypothetical protein